MDRLLIPHLQQLNNVIVYKIPDPSSLSFTSQQFLQRHVQSRGLLNDGQVCGLLNVFLVFHRMKLISFFVDPTQIKTNNNPDFPVLMLMKILKALPSQDSFSIQLFVQSWNRSLTLQNARARLGMNDDIMVCLHFKKSRQCKVSHRIE